MDCRDNKFRTNHNHSSINIPLNLTHTFIYPLKLTKDGLVAVDARILKGKLEYSEIQREKKRPDFLKNDRVVIVGASTEKGKTGYTIAKNAQSFKGELLYVNAKGRCC